MNKIIIVFTLCLGFNVLAGQIKLICSPSKAAVPLSFASNNNEFLLSDLSNVKVISWENLNLTTYSFAGSLNCATSLDENIIAIESIKNGKYQTVIFKKNDPQIKVIHSENAIQELSIAPDNAYIAIESAKSIMIYSLIDYQLIGSIKKEEKRGYRNCTFSDKHLLVRSEDKIELLKLPKLELALKFSTQDDSSRLYEYQKNSQDEKLTISFEKLKLMKNVFFSPNSNTPLFSADEKKIAFFDMNNVLNIFDRVNQKMLWSKDFSEEAHAMLASYSQVDPQWKSFAIANKDKGITLYNLQTGEERCQIYSIDPEDILITIPSGYYMATRRGAFEGINFEQDGQIFDFAQFDLQYNRPDLVLEHIGLSPPETIEAFRKAYERRVAYLGGKPDSNDHNLPSVQFAKELPVFTDKSKLEVAINAQDAKEILDVIHVYVNGTPLYGKAGYSIKNRKTRAFQHSINLTLTSGDNRIEVEIFNVKLQRSQRIQSTVRCETPTAKPNLHLISIGVSQYAESGKNLLYAGKDAQGVHDLFAGKTDLYEKVILHPLWEKDFSPSNLEKVKQALMQTKESDQVIVFYAGHGVVDSALNYYLGSSNLNFNYPAGSGIRYEQLEALLDGIPARQRLMMLDACFSGEIDKSNAKRIQVENTVVGTVRFRTSDLGLVPNNTAYERSFNLMREWFADLRPNSGATILSSTSGLQQAAEGELWKNGVFTWCLLEGLKGKKADTNQDGMVMLSELRDYLESAVTSQNRQQQSTFRSENLVGDWRIW